ncbi:MAG: sigma-70 family RNA polymerase sigma factor [Erysipelotrichaceae bacterium]|nr:sigma-70 family RNA polymerase sigma factor [Erysipelotrichaceae bacterium]
MSEEEKAKIYEDYYLRVRNYILSKINNFEEAQDLCSDVFVKVYDKLDTFDKNKSSISTWIFTITKNTLIDYYRSNHVELELNDNIQYEVDEDDEDDDICTPDNLDKLAEALKMLSDKERFVIVSYYYSGKTLKEISVNMGISYAYVKILHKKALFELKKCINL